MRSNKGERSRDSNIDEEEHGGGGESDDSSIGRNIDKNKNSVTFSVIFQLDPARQCNENTCDVKKTTFEGIKLIIVLIIYVLQLYRR